MQYYDPAIEKGKVASTLFKCLLFIFLLIYFTSCANILGEFGNPNTEAALIKEIENTLNTNPTSALTKYQELPTSISSKREHQVLLASIYASLCGQNFLNVTESLLGADNMFVNLMGVFPGAVNADITNCKLARDVISNIDSDAVNRSQKENVLMAYIAWSTIGAIVSQSADADEDGTVDAGHDACTDITDVDAASVGVAMNTMLDSLENAGTSLTGAIQYALIAPICAGGAPPNFCGIKDQTTMEVDGSGELDEIRGIIKSDGGIGLAECALCACP